MRTADADRRKVPTSRRRKSRFLRYRGPYLHRPMALRRLRWFVDGGFRRLPTAVNLAGLADRSRRQVGRSVNGGLHFLPVTDIGVVMLAGTAK